MKTCNRCGVAKPLSEFYRHSGKSSLMPKCKSCHTKQANGCRRKRVTGCSVEEYKTLYIEQSGCCKICGKHESKCAKNLAADHCHSTNKVRGLLCPTCNMALGLFKDSTNLLQLAIEYLETNDGTG